MKKLKLLKSLLKELYIKITCVMCCKSNCTIVVGKNNKQDNVDENNQD